MISVDLTSSPLMPEGVGVDLLDLGDHLADRHLDAEVVDLVAVVRGDDVDEVLADVVDVALHRGDDELALRRRAVDAFHVRLEVGDRRLHRLRRLQHERQLHLPGAEQLADDLHPVEQHGVDDVEGGHPAGHRLVEVDGEPVAVAVDDARLEPLVDRAVPLRSGFSVFSDLTSANTSSSSAAAGRSRGRAPVPHQVEADLALLGRQAVERDDLGGVDDRRVEAGLHALVEEHAVEGVARGRRQPEADVGQAEHGVGAGDLGLDPADRLDRGDGVAAQVVVARRERERQRVEDQVARLQPVALGGDLGDAVGDLHLPLDVAGLAALVDEQADHGSAVVAGEREHAVQPAARAARRPRGSPS